MGGAKKRMLRFGWAWLAGIANCAKLAAGSMKSRGAQPPLLGAKAPPAPPSISAPDFQVVVYGTSNKLSAYMCSKGTSGLKKWYSQERC